VGLTCKFTLLLTPDVFAFTVTGNLKFPEPKVRLTVAQLADGLLIHQPSVWVLIKMFTVPPAAGTAELLSSTAEKADASGLAGKSCFLQEIKTKKQNMNDNRRKLFLLIRISLYNLVCVTILDFGSSFRLSVEAFFVESELNNLFQG
jgi:hypothetical protein